MSVQARNEFKRRGKPVTNDDIRARAKPGHPFCSGKGFVLYTPAGAAAPQEQNCPCAVTRFMAAHPELIVNADGFAWWPAEDQPEEAPAPPLAAAAGGDDGEEDEAGPPGRLEVQLERLVEKRMRLEGQLVVNEGELAAAVEDLRPASDAAQAALDEALAQSAAVVAAGEEELEALVNLRAGIGALEEQVAVLRAEMRAVEGRLDPVKGEHALRVQEVKLRLEALGAVVQAVRDQKAERTRKWRQKINPLRQSLERLDRRIARVNRALGNDPGTAPVEEPSAPAVIDPA